MTTPELTDAMIAETMARAHTRACGAGEKRCYELAADLEGARATCTSQGRCLIGWIVADSGRQELEVWPDLKTGEGHFGKRTPG